MATADKDLAKLLDQVSQLPGWRVQNTSRAYKIFPPRGGQPLGCPHGPRNPWRTRKNLIAKLRRAGAPI